jgi:hypothetical protein
VLERRPVAERGAALQVNWEKKKRLPELSLKAKRLQVGGRSTLSGPALAPA